MIDDYISEIQERTGWSDRSILYLLIQYIENQNSDDALVDFLEKAAEDELDQT